MARRRLRLMFAAVLLVTGLCGATAAQVSTVRASSETTPAAASPAAAAEAVRANLASAQLYAGFAPERAKEYLVVAEGAWTQLRERLAGDAGVQVVERAFEQANEALAHGELEGLATARGRLWTALLNATRRATLAAIDDGDYATAQALLGAREYRRATQVSTPGTEATNAMGALVRGETSVQDATAAVNADLLDAYQARLTTALDDLARAQAAGQSVRAAELLALGEGYFEVLAPEYLAQRGDVELAAAWSAMASGDPAVMAAALDGFRAAPLNPAARNRLAAQLFRYLPLVGVEYGRGVGGGGGAVRVTSDIEIMEARAFYQGALGTYRDLEPLLYQLDAGAVPGLRAGFSGLESGLAAAAQGEDPPGAEAMQRTVKDLIGALTAVVPAEWRRANAGGDIQVISDQLDALVQAVAAGRYDLAESTRLDAYAVLESGPEARLRVFQPELSARLEALFWNGSEPRGLARLVRDRATQAEVEDSIGALRAALQEAEAYLHTQAAPAAVAANAGIIVFREGLEAVLILAALLGSLKKPEVRHLRRPLWAGAGVALLATAATWFALRGVLTEFARYGEKLEAVVSVVALAVLLLIMNWFFHQVYWTDHLAGFHKRKAGLQGSGQYLGLALLGLSAVYREGFETVLFLQSLVLQSGAGAVVQGILVGLAATVGVGLVIFLLQHKLPYRKMLVATGLLVLIVIVFMAGNTLHVLQLVGWLPAHALPISFPTWAGVWLGTFATYEGVLAQVLSVALVVGSYFLAEGAKARARRGARGKAEQARGGSQRADGGRRVHAVPEPQGRPTSDADRAGG